MTDTTPGIETPTTPSEGGAPASSTEDKVGTPEIATGEEPLISDTAESTKVASPAYSPSYKYNANGEELEFDAWARPLITNADLEKKFQELFQAQKGLPLVKKLRDEYKAKHEELSGKYGNIEKSLNYVSDLVKKGDMESFFQALQIPEDKILRYAIEKLKFSQLPPEEQQKIVAQRQDSQRLQTVEQQNAELQTQIYQSQVEMRSRELQGELSKPEVQAVVQHFDSRTGRPGAFREEVIKRGIAYHTMTGEDLPVENAVKEVLSLISQSVQNGTVPQPGAADVAPQSHAAVVEAQSKKPVIPNLQGQGGSPVKRTPKSLDDLRKLRDNFSS